MDGFLKLKSRVARERGVALILRRKDGATLLCQVAQKIADEVLFIGSKKSDVRLAEFAELAKYGSSDFRTLMHFVRSSIKNKAKRRRKD